jgi:hypothetical protein
LNHQRIRDIGDDHDEPDRIICGPSVARGYLRPGQTIHLSRPRSPGSWPSARSRMTYVESLVLSPLFFRAMLRSAAAPIATMTPARAPSTIGRASIFGKYSMQGEGGGGDRSIDDGGGNASSWSRLSFLLTSSSKKIIEDRNGRASPQKGKSIYT